MTFQDIFSATTKAFTKLSFFMMRLVELLKGEYRIFYILAVNLFNI